MDIEHLKLILETLERAGGGASNAFIWYLVFQLVGKLIPYTALVVGCWFIGAALKRFMDFDNLMRQFGYDPDLNWHRDNFRARLYKLRDQIIHQ